MNFRDFQMGEYKEDLEDFSASHRKLNFRKIAAIYRGVHIDEPS